MANSKHAHLRYNILDYCFRSKSFNFNELLDYVNQKIAESYPGEGVSVRTLRDDLKVFRDSKNGFGAPLPEKIRLLRYTDPNFSIAKRPLLAYENYLLEAAQQLLERFENHPRYDKLAEALITFQDEEEQEGSASKILFYDHNEEYKGIKYLKPLYLAIKKQQVLQITYQGFNNDSLKTYEFHPHVLKQYNRRWFVFGFNSTENVKEWSIPLDERIVSFEILDTVDYLQTNSDYSQVFRNRVGVTKPKDALVEKVVLKFYNGREAYFKSKPLHPDYEEFFEPEKQNQVWFETIINKELVQQLLSYGKDVEVIAPKQLKALMQIQSKEMKSFYDN